MDTPNCSETVEKLDENILQDIIEKTNKIHAEFLFWGPLTYLLKVLSMNLCATPSSLRYNGWVELGIKLGLEDIAVKSIENTNIMDEDPVYVMLLAYSQKDDSTIANIYFSLFELQRKDIVRRTYPTVLKFIQDILQIFQMPSVGILRSPKKPQAPHIFKNIEPTLHNTTVTQKQKLKTKFFKKIVMLTYIIENNKIVTKAIVEKIVKEFRKELNGKSIGLVILEEHREEILKNPNIVQTFYKSAHYIIPILTTDYLTYVASENTPGSCIDNLDENYATYIYNSMMHDYLKTGCKNKHVRCIIPDDDFENVQKHYFFQPLFQAWIKESDISNMAIQILDGKI